MRLASAQQTPLLERGALAAVLAVGAALRISAAVDHPHHVSADQRAYTLLASALANHGRYASPDLSGAFHWPPGAPVAFAVAERIAGAHTGPYAAQVLLGTLTVLAAWWVARMVSGWQAGLLAAAAVALYPPLVNSAGELLSEPLAALLVTSAVGAGAWGLRGDGLVRMAPCGALLGLLILTRADAELFPLIIGACVFAYRRRPEGARRALASGAVVVVAAGLTVLPWVAVVSAQKHTFVPVSTGGGSNLFVGTYLPGHGTIFGLKHAYGPKLRASDPKLRNTPDFRLSEAQIIAYVAGKHRGLGEDAWLRRKGISNGVHYLTHQPLAFTGMMAQKAGRLWLDYTHGSQRRSTTLGRIGHIVLIVLALAGLIFGLRRRRDFTFVCIAALLVCATLVNAVLVSEARHLLPLLPLLFAGGAAGALSGRFQVSLTHAGKDGAP